MIRARTCEAHRQSAAVLVVQSVTACSSAPADDVHGGITDDDTDCGGGGVGPYAPGREEPLVLGVALGLGYEGGRVMRILHSGPDTTILTPLCAGCPYGAPGCCVVPPRVTLSDVGRIVSRGGRDWLLEQLGAGRIIPRGEWLIIARTSACTFLGERGCTVPFERRPATCNYYVCERALEPEGATSREREAEGRRDELEATFARWDAELARRAKQRFPDGLAWDAGSLDWLGLAFEDLLRA